MRIHLAMYFVFLFVVACSSKKQKSTKQSIEQEYLIRLKNAPQNSTLMFNLHFGENRFKVQKKLKELLVSGEILSLDQQGFCYKLDISNFKDSIPPSFDEHGDGNNDALPFNELYFYAMPAFSNDKLSSIHVTQFLNFNSNEIKDWMNRDLTIISKEMNMRKFANKCIRVIAATKYLLRTKYSFFDVQEITKVRSESSGMFERKGDPVENLTTYWTNDFYATISEEIKYTKYDFPPGSGFEGFGKMLLNSNFSGYQNVISLNESRILVLNYKSPMYDKPTTSNEWLFQEQMDKEEEMANEREIKKRIINDSLKGVKEKEKKSELKKI
ncbi:MAG: hypothetical protein WDO71_25105 [Bacteroidota bacterium]